MNRDCQKILLIDVNRSMVALTDGCEILWKIDEKRLFQGELQFPGIENQLPTQALSQVVNVQNLHYILINDQWIRQIPGMEHLPIQYHSFSLKTDERTIIRCAAKILEASRETTNISESIHVLHLFEGCGGGPFKLFLDQVKGLEQLGITSSCLCCKENDVELDIPQELSIDYVLEQDVAGRFPSFDGFVNFRRVEEILLKKSIEIHERIPIDVIHVHSVAGALAALTMKRVFSIPVFVTQHVTNLVMEEETGRLSSDYPYYTPELRENLRDCFRREVELLSAADLVIAPSKSSCREILNNFEISQKKIRFIPNGVRSSVKHDISLKTYLKNIIKNRKVISFVGALTKVKGIDLFLEIIENILREEDVEIFVAGLPWANHASFEEMLKKHQGNRQRIHYLGRVTPKEVRTLLAQTDILLCPSRYDSFSLVVVEAMAEGAVPVVSDRGGISELLFHGKNGIVVEGLKTEKFAQAVVSLLQNPLKLTEMKKFAKDSSVDWSIGRSLTKLANLYLTKKE